MPRAIRLSLVVAAVCLSTMPVAASSDPSDAPGEQASAILPGTPPLSLAPLATTDPFSRLFEPPAQPEAAVETRPLEYVEYQQPAIVCGMRIVPADPAVDPGMRVDPPDSETRFTLRIVEPPLCGRD